MQGKELNSFLFAFYTVHSKDCNDKENVNCYNHSRIRYEEENTLAGWGEDYEKTETDKREVKINFGKIISFKTMCTVVTKMCEEAGTGDENHPKEELLALWTNIMIVLMVLFTFSYNILIAATGLFFFFYFYALVQVYTAWKQFGYSRKYFLFISAIGILLAAVFGTMFKEFLFEVLLG